MLKDLNRLLLAGRRQAAAWRRWHRKLPHNRVRRPRIRDANGRPVGHGPAEPWPEPVVSSPFCERVELPSRRTDVRVHDFAVEAAYRSARHPRPTPAEVQPLPIAEELIRKLFKEYCQ